MKQFEAIKSGSRIVAQAGLALVGKILEKAGIRSIAESMPVSKEHPQNTFSEGDVIVATIGKMCAGNTTFESIREYKGDTEFYQDALGISGVISPERLRQRLNQCAGETADGLPFQDAVREMNMAVLFQGPSPRPLKCGLIPLDIDVTPYDESKSHKEGVSRTYKNFDGYAPICAYIGLHGSFLNTEFRVGSQHCQKGTVDFLIKTIDLANRYTHGRKLLVRMDSGNDAVANLAEIMKRGHYFIVKRNIRKESKEQWLALAEQYVEPEKLREGKFRYVGSTWKEIRYTELDGTPAEKKVRVVYEIIKRTIAGNGQIYLLPDVEVNTWWDNTGYAEEDVIELYHQHGTSEQYHAELKSEMNMERLPSGRFATNCLVHELSMVAYNVLRMLGLELAGMECVPMRQKADRRRFRTVICNIIRIPARVLKSGRRMRLDVGSSNLWSDAFVELMSMP